MHSKGIFHGDLTREYGSLVKSVSFDSNARAFYIIDFGSARFLTEKALQDVDNADQIAHEFERVKDNMHDLIGNQVRIATDLAPRQWPYQERSN